MGFLNNTNRTDGQKTGLSKEKKPVTSEILKKKFGVPHRIKTVKPQASDISKYVYHENAVEFVKNVGPIMPCTRVYSMLPGYFYMSDFVMTFISHNNMRVKKMIVSTLSIDFEAVDALYNVLDWGYVDNLSLLISDMSFFYNRAPGGIIEYLFSRLEKFGERVQISVIYNHSKLILLETHKGNKITIHGSMNIRSSESIENMCIENVAETHDFFANLLLSLENQFAVVNHSVPLSKHTLTTPYKRITRKGVDACIKEAFEFRNSKPEF